MFRFLMTLMVAMLEVRAIELANASQFKKNEIIENWRYEYAIPYYEEDQVEIDW